MVNNNGIINLLVSYVKPIHLLAINADTPNNIRMNNTIYMLTWICKYLNLCCQIDQNCVIMLLKCEQQQQLKNMNMANNLIFDLIECLNLSEVNKFQLRPFYSVLFELLSTFLSMYDDRTIVDNVLIIISKCWIIISNYMINDLLCNENIASDKITQPRNSGESEEINFSSNKDDISENCMNLFENALRFYSLYLAKLTQLTPNSINSSTNNNIKVLCENISYLFDSIEVSETNNQLINKRMNVENAAENQNSLGAVLTRKLIKLFDKYFLVDTNLSLKQIVANLIKGLFALSNTAKQVAVNCK